MDVDAILGMAEDHLEDINRNVGFLGDSLAAITAGHVAITPRLLRILYRTLLDNVQDVVNNALLDLDLEDGKAS